MHRTLELQLLRVIIILVALLLRWPHHGGLSSVRMVGRLFALFEPYKVAIPSLSHIRELILKRWFWIRCDCFGAWLRSRFFRCMLHFHSVKQTDWESSCSSFVVYEQNVFTIFTKVQLVKDVISLTENTLMRMLCRIIQQVIQLLRTGATLNSLIVMPWPSSHVCFFPFLFLLVKQLSQNDTLNICLP